jgi:hypothetical protein
MTSIPPSIPFHLAKAYGVSPVRAVSPVSPAFNTEQASVAGNAEPKALGKPPGPIDRLIAAVVPGGVDFSGEAPKPGRTSLPFYHHPADRNAAATRVRLGGSLDVNG